MSKRREDDEPVDDGDEADEPGDEDEPTDEDESADEPNEEEEEEEEAETAPSAARRAALRRRRRRRKRKPARARGERPDETPAPERHERAAPPGELPLAQHRRLALGATVTVAGIAIVAMADPDIGAIVVVAGLLLLMWAIHRFGRLGVESR